MKEVLLVLGIFVIIIVAYFYADGDIPTWQDCLDIALGLKTDKRKENDDDEQQSI